MAWEFRGSVDLNVTPPNMPSTSFNRNSPSLSIDPQILEDTLIDIVDIAEASPIPKIPLTLARRAKQSADIPNSREKIKEKRDIAERKKKQIESKINKIEATKKKTNNEKKIK
ncbi:hypothetical protein SFRURICE_003523 [Spodoptera frugiperda]|nr:hypothetical protein SFRURICE_003523 [Spodoptera frugiperda]